jgi:predicted negative regulator of RcsB-dependent stress response
MAEAKKELSKKDSFLIALSNFLQKNRIVFIIIIIVLIAGLVAFTIARESIKNRIEKSTFLAEEAREAYHNWSTAVDDEQKTIYREECLEIIEQIMDSYPNHYAAQRASFLQGNIFFEEENWTEAAAAYEKIFTKFSDSYLAPISLNNASVAYENSGELDTAIEMLNTLTENYTESFADIARIFFTKGRLYEEQGDMENAVRAYNVLVDDFSNSNWTKLARNRIIALEK